MKKEKFPSELRLDIVSGDWVVISKKRFKRPKLFQMKRKKPRLSKKDCPFCHLGKKTPKPVMIFEKGKKLPQGKFSKNWTLAVVPNKYPAFLPAKKMGEKKEGKFYKVLEAVGFHEVVITKDHKKQLAEFSVSQIKEVFSAFQERYLALKKEKFVNHIFIFHNHGQEAGASIPHPHSQIITTPLIDLDLKRALLKAKRYFQKNKKCIYCEMNKWEKRVKKRIVFENEEFLVLCPFASKTAFQMIVSPKKHLSYFEKITQREKEYLAKAFKIALSKLYKTLSDPPYNFYLHTAPADGKDYRYYHWHWTILPKTSILAGFEFGAKIEISTIEPEKAAYYLRKI